MAEDYGSAASRHQDSGVLLGAHEHWQEAAYVSGYAAECALKLLIERGGTLKGRQYGHSLVLLAGEGLVIALLLSPLLSRYRVEPLDSSVPGLASWSEQSRYEATTHLPAAQEQFTRIAGEAQGIAKKILVELTLDGLLEEIPA